MFEEEKVSLKTVDDVWKDFLIEFNEGTLNHDQILIIGNNLFLRGPNLDLVQLNDQDGLIN